MSSAHKDTKSHVSHISQSYADVNDGKKQHHELNDKYAIPAAKQPPSDNLPFDKKSSDVEGNFYLSCCQYNKTFFL
ncbi:11645_t:CDS:2 [Entrophospora sp. SA101]|nr:5127_t:CDS:2 [Entrophospora sp. SA101]CAJ0639723.1 11645_t:CDS:2 [Entrophospora sp. SA101]CAJ0827485.1 9189_t:CDS:2 [Entrophospora sp. SA101]CAJ0904359.1 14625_t:CDS:2 [Entrophospora sp. SA101]